MKVSELIEKLKSCPQDARVVAPGYEDGVDDVFGTKEVHIKPEAHADQWFYGHHAHLLKKEPGSEEVILLVTNRRYGDGD